MDRNGTREADGIVQPVAHLIVPGMALLVTITHPTSKRSCWLITTWMVPFFLTFGSRVRNLLSLCTPGNPSLRGRMGDFLFENMSNLLTVHFSASSIAGDIPKEIVKMTKLQNFLACIMHGDGLTGSLPEDIGNMKELRVLCLGGSNLTGQIPKTISALNKLWYLDLRNTPGKMYGTLSDILALPSLTDLFISGA